MQTWAGRVVYNRKKNPFKLRDVLRIAISLANTMTTEQKEDELWQINAIFEVVSNSFYPVWQRAANPPQPNTFETKQLFYEIETELRQAWYEKTFEICDRVGEEMGIPKAVREWVVSYMGNFIWDVIWKVTDPFFK